MVQPYSGSLYSFPSLCCCTLTVSTVQVWVGSPLMHVYIIPSFQGTYVLMYISHGSLHPVHSSHTCTCVHTERDREGEGAGAEARERGSGDSHC